MRRHDHEWVPANELWWCTHRPRCERRAFVRCDRFGREIACFHARCHVHAPGRLSAQVRKRYPSGPWPFQKARP